MPIGGSITKGSPDSRRRNLYVATAMPDRGVEKKDNSKATGNLSVSKGKSGVSENRRMSVPNV